MTIEGLKHVAVTYTVNTGVLISP